MRSLLSASRDNRKLLQFPHERLCTLVSMDSSVFNLVLARTAE
jgi:hypothetical protein